MSTLAYSPGSLVHARGRDWIVLTGSDAEVLRVRPISGTEEDQTLIHLALEAEPVTEASFEPPTPEQQSSHEAALLLRDALLLSLRRGAGPFRSFGQIAVEPRAYQLVPLLMALKQDPVRLLIADDVGVGKTIEAALIARELLDRGLGQRMAVLCPPHLVDQWVGELNTRFHIRAVPVTAANARRLERNVPPQESIFSIYPFTVVSLDYIKSQSRRDRFLHTCPELVMVDEAHTCASTGRGRHQRHELLKGLTESPTRHLVMLTATPHSGDEAAFFRMLGLLDRRFEDLAVLQGEPREKLRQQLSLHFVQRRRPDIAEWKEGRLFPKRETTELTYQLTGEWEAFFDAVLDYCAEVVGAAGSDRQRQRLKFWSTLALLRCAASSPVAAVSALRTRAGLETSEEERDEILDRIFDGSAEALPEDDIEPPVGMEDPALAALISQAERLAGQQGDPKLELLTTHLADLVGAGFSPVVFCRYIATAHYLGRHLRGKLPDLSIAVATGEVTADERKAIVEELGQAERRLLVATDCLSEGINLQDSFDAVVHYDLSWNPTRHEQREGRVDRFGQERPVVRTTLMYGENNPVDGAVLEVILRKAKKIGEELGVPVPLPDEGHTLSQALMRAVLLRRRNREDRAQTSFLFPEMEEARAIDTCWRDAAEKAKKNRTVFAQRRLKPDDVLPEWRKALAAMGGREDVERFTGRALARLGAPLEPLRRGFKAPLGALPEDVRERLELEGLSGNLRVYFDGTPASRERYMQRSHPLVTVLAETLLARTLATSGGEADSDPSALGRTGCWIAPDVTVLTTVLLLRLRHQLVIQKPDAAVTLLVEEAASLAWAGPGTDALEGAAALSLLVPPPSGDPPPHVRQRQVQRALQQLHDRRAELDDFARSRAETLLADHRRVRQAAHARGTYSVNPLLPADIIGLYVLLPRVD